MASDSAGSRQRGYDSVEYKVVQNHLGPLVKQSQLVLCELANELYGRPQQLISKLEHTNAIDNNQSSYDRASKVMNSVLTKIEDNSLLFYEFVEALQASELHSIANDLENALREEKSLCPTIPSGGIPQDIVTSLNKVAFPTAVSVSNVASLQATFCYTFQTSGPPAGTIQETNLPISSSTDAMPELKQDCENSDSVPSQIEPPTVDDSPTDLQPTEAFSAPIPSSQFSPYEGTGGAVQVQTTGTPTSSSSVLPSHSSPQFNTSIDQLPLRQLLSGWRGQSLYKSSPVVGDEFEFCVKPGQPLALNPLIDALSTPLHCPIKLVQIQRSSTRHVFEHPAFLHTPQEEGDSSGVRFPIQSTQAEEEDMLDSSEVGSCHMPSAAIGHNFIKRGSFQSSCFCHVRIRVLKVKLDNRMSEIQILKKEIEELEKNFDEERKRISDALQEQTQLRAQREKVIEILKDDIAHRDRLLKQLDEEKAEFERKIGELQKCCEEKQWIAEQKAEFTAEKSASIVRENQEKCKMLEKKLEEQTRKSEEDQAKIAKLERELKEVRQRETKRKLEYFQINSATLQSETVACVEAHIAEKNKVACSTLVPKLKLRAERESVKAASENDIARAKEAEELAKKAEHLLYISKPMNRCTKIQNDKSANEKQQE